MCQDAEEDCSEDAGRIVTSGLEAKVFGQGLDRHTIQSPYAVPRCVVIPTTGEHSPLQRRPAKRDMTGLGRAVPRSNPPI